MAREAVAWPPEETLSLWKREQARLKALVVDRDTEAWQRDAAFSGLQRVGGVDVSFVKGDSVSACASLVVLSYPELEVVYEDCCMVSLTAPYVSGFLAFREVPFLVDAVRRLREKEPRLVPQAGPPCGWKWGSPPPRLRSGLSPWRPHRLALRWGSQETPTGGRARERCPAQGEDTTSAGWRRFISSDRRLWDCPGHGPEEPQAQQQAPLRLCGPQDKPGGRRAPHSRLLQVPDPRARAPGKPVRSRPQEETSQRRGKGSPGSRTHICKGPGAGMDLMPAGKSEEGAARARAGVAQGPQQGFLAGTWVLTSALGTTSAGPWESPGPPHQGRRGARRCRGQRCALRKVRKSRKVRAGPPRPTAEAPRHRKGQQRQWGAELDMAKSSGCLTSRPCLE
uniref:endonuclease V isoform X1 n=1 Tax=Halichoerus grypus TaxID=9711 RepID=UPI0016595C01|nr:endonuclease V isoform X1 [Halichoerus grypus]